jgi:hypothetical protein
MNGKGVVMSGLRISLLGAPLLECEGAPLKLDTRKNLALVAYLAVTGETHTREALVTLLWPEMDPSRARAALRRNLSVLKNTLGGERLVVDGESVGADPLESRSEQCWQAFLHGIQCAAAYHAGELGSADQVAVRTLDGFALTVEPEGPTSYFPHLMAFIACCPMPRHVVGVHGDAWAELENIVRNGPFHLASWERRESLVRERNPTYQGRDPRAALDEPAIL